MGMGDAPKPFEPYHKAIRCDVTGKMFAECCVRSCPHPKVIDRYGVGGKANVCVYVCRKCKHHIEYKYHGGVNCGYMGQ